MKVDLYTLCWNEIKIIPFVIDYWKNIKEQIDEFHVYVYDNGEVKSNFLRTKSILDFYKKLSDDNRDRL